MIGQPAESRGLWRSTVWLIALAVLISSSVLVFRLVIALRSERPAKVGDGRHVATYGFDLSTCLIPPEEIVAAGLPKDGLRALVSPPVMTALAVDSLNAAERGKYLVSDDRVIGVEIDGLARAYPLRLLNWHEVANDTVGGRAIAVTYNPLCDSCVGFERQVGGERLEFGCSGLLLNSNLLMYDRRPGGTGESLWSQLQGRAVAGPAARDGLVLEILPIAVVTWRQWRAWHPETTVVFPEPAMRASYKRDPYASYYGSDRLRFPVSPGPLAGELRHKDRIVAVHLQDGWRAYPLRVIADSCDAGGQWSTSAADTRLRFFCRLEPAEIAVTDDRTTNLVPIIHTFWFAWQALRPNATLQAE